MKTRWLFVIACFIFLSGFLHTPQRDWQLTFYEHQNILSDHVYLGYFETLLDCQITGGQLKARFPGSTFGCAFGCRPSDPDMEGLSTCKEVYREWTGRMH